eukprot:3988832-Lingulodinium_polyedra.AAC.1
MREYRHLRGGERRGDVEVQQREQNSVTGCLHAAGLGDPDAVHPGPRLRQHRIARAHVDHRPEHEAHRPHLEPSDGLAEPHVRHGGADDDREGLLLRG